MQVTASVVARVLVLLGYEFNSDDEATIALLLCELALLSLVEAIRQQAGVKSEGRRLAS